MPATLEEHFAMMKERRYAAPEIECSLSEPLEWEPDVPEWEYKTSMVSGYTIRTSARLDPALNAQGRDGWELVQLIPTELEGEGYHRAIFKRRRRTELEQGKGCECENQGKEGVQ